jgi:hypothetical protein
VAAHATTRGRAKGAGPRRLTGDQTGWHGRGEWRLLPWEASWGARRIEAGGRYWSAPFALGQGAALVEVRDRRRPYPLLHRLRTPDELARFLDEQRREEQQQQQQHAQEGGR